MQEYIRKYLKKLADENGGTLTPEKIVEDAQDPDSPLHEEFEWDDEKAAHQHRLMQARTLIRTINIIEHHREVTIRTPEWVRDPDLPVSEQGYIHLSSLESDHDRAVRALNQELDRVTSLLKRAREIALKLNLSGELDTYIAQFSTFKNQVAATGPRRRSAVA